MIHIRLCSTLSLIIAFTTLISIQLKCVFGVTYCDTTQACLSQTLSDTQVICRGYLGCESAVSITTTSSYILCDASYACRYSGAMVSYTHIYCRSVYSCFKVSSMTATTGSIICESIYSCRKAQGDLNSYSYIVCRGYYACADSVLGGLYSQTSYITCSGTGSCQNVTAISSYANLDCDGYVSCRYVDNIGISSTTSYVACDGDRSCEYSNIISVNTYLYCMGDQSCLGTTITGASIIFGYGYYSLQNSIISTENINNVLTLTVYFYGYYSGSGSSITCEGGYNCTINCQGNGCNGAVITCYGNCFINCDENNGDDCPNGYFGPTEKPTYFPTLVPTDYPTNNPTDSPTDSPTRVPTDNPTPAPTFSPINPTKFPTFPPTIDPTNNPTKIPSKIPTNPSLSPTNIPTEGVNCDEWTDICFETGAITISDITGEDSSSTNNSSDLETTFGKIGIWIIGILLLLLIISIMINVSIFSKMSGMKSILKHTKNMLISEQSEMYSQLQKRQGTNVAIQSMANLSGMSTDSMIPTSPNKHANLINQWASTNAIQQPPNMQRVVSMSSDGVVNNNQLSQPMGTLESQQRYHQAIAEALGRINSASVSPANSPPPQNNNNINNIQLVGMNGNGIGGIGGINGQKKEVGGMDEDVMNEGIELPPIPGINENNIRIGLNNNNNNLDDSDDDQVMGGNDIQAIYNVVKQNKQTANGPLGE